MFLLHTKNTIQTQLLLPLLDHETADAHKEEKGDIEHDENAQPHYHLK